MKVKVRSMFKMLGILQTAPRDHATNCKFILIFFTAKLVNIIYKYLMEGDYWL